MVYDTLFYKTALFANVDVTPESHMWAPKYATGKLYLTVKMGQKTFSVVSTTAQMLCTPFSVGWSVVHLFPLLK